MKRSALVIALVLLVVAGTLGWQHRGRAFAWWHVRQLVESADTEREARLLPFAGLGEAAVRPLLAEWKRDDAATCLAIEGALRSVSADWASDDERTARTLAAVRSEFTGFSTVGRKAALRFASSVGARGEEKSIPAAQAKLLAELVAIAEPDDELRAAAMGLAGSLVERVPTGQLQSTARSLAVKGLASTDAQVRMAALQLLMRDPLRKDNDLLANAAPCLRDADAAVRRAALVAVGSADVVSADQLLPLLHDPDLAIQALCETVLRSRGLSDPQIRLGRMVSDDDPAVRLQVIPLLRQTIDLDVDVWLRRLTLDPAPAVRAAAVRSASAEPSDDLRRRLSEMAGSDPSATVRELARFYVDRSTLRKVGN